jgi:hypothetical protein
MRGRDEHTGSHVRYANRRQTARRDARAAGTVLVVAGIWLLVRQPRAKKAI